LAFSNRNKSINRSNLHRRYANLKCCIDNDNINERDPEQDREPLLNREYSVEGIHPPRHVEIGAVSLPVKIKCVRVSQLDNILLAVVPVQPQTCTVAPFYAKPASRSVAAFMTD